MSMTRRELLALTAGAPLLGSRAPAAPVAVARCPSYREDVTALLGGLFDQLGGLGRLVKGKTVTVKLNMTGSPATRVGGRPPALTHYCHPKVVGALVHHLGRAGARCIRLVESAFQTAAPLEEYMLDSGWRVRSLQRAADRVEFENTNTLGKGKRYARLTVPGRAWIFPGYDLNHSYADTDVFVSLAKLKQHQTCGVTLSLKNCFGNLPASIYGDDAGRDEPNETPGSGRGQVCHFGKRPPSLSAPQELDPASPRDPGYRVPRITAEVCAARPIHLAVIDGVETIAGGEGPWNPGVRPVRPGLLIAGLNPVSTDAVATALMGLDPRASRGSTTFPKCDNTLLLAEQLGVGSTDLEQIDVRGVSIEEAIYRFAG